tara:strand:+ start:471 stop:680 length:210 start_codon:yes stop_codon:yes gene_type:complete
MHVRHISTRSDHGVELLTANQVIDERGTDAAARAMDDGDTALSAVPTFTQRSSPSACITSTVFPHGSEM